MKIPEGGGEGGEPERALENAGDMQNARRGALGPSPSPRCQLTGGRPCSGAPLQRRLSHPLCVCPLIALPGTPSTLLAQPRQAWSGAEDEYFL